MSSRISSRALCAFAGVSLLAFLAAGCGGGGSDRDASGASANSVTVRGRVVLEIGKPAASRRVRVPASGAVVVTDAQGIFAVSVPRADPRLALGTTADAGYTVRVALDGGEGLEATDAKAGAAVQSKSAVTSFEAELGAPLFEPDTSSAIAAPLSPGTQSSDAVLEDPSLPGLSLRISRGARVSYPPGASEVRLLGLATARLGLALPDRVSTRLAAMIAPAGLSIAPAATLRLPNVEGAGPGTTVDVFHLDASTGGFLRTGVATVSVDGNWIEGAAVDRGGIWLAAVPVALPTTTLRGRIQGLDRQDVAGYSVLGPAGRAAVTTTNGSFEILDVPVRDGELIRLRLLSPLRFRPESIVTDAKAAQAGGQVDFGVLPVDAFLRTPSPPSVSFSPSSGQSGVAETTRVVVTFGRPMDLDTIGVALVRGVSRAQKSVAGNLSVRRTADSTRLEFVPLAPLQNGTFYTIFAPEGARDIDGNVVDADRTSARFTVRGTPAVPAPDAVVVRSLSLAEGVRGDELVIVGSNLDVNAVMFGQTRAIPIEQGPRGESIRIAVPSGISGEQRVSVSGAGDLPFRALPTLGLVDDLAAMPLAGEAVTGRGLHLGATPVLLVGDIRGGVFTRMDPPGGCQDSAECWSITLPEGADPGMLRLEVDGIPSESLLVTPRRVLDATPPRVLTTSFADGERLASATVALEVELSEAVDGGSTVTIERNGGGAVPGVVVTVSADGTRISVAPPPGGWPLDEDLTLEVGAGVRDLAGNPLDQDEASAGLQATRRTFRVDSPAP